MTSRALSISAPYRGQVCPSLWALYLAILGGSHRREKRIHTWPYSPYLDMGRCGEESPVAEYGAGMAADMGARGDHPSADQAENLGPTLRALRAASGESVAAAVEALAGRHRRPASKPIRRALWPALPASRDLAWCCLLRQNLSASVM